VHGSPQPVFTVRVCVQQDVCFGEVHFFGTALYLLIGSDPSVNLKLNGVSYIAAMIWCYYDGVFARRKWSVAWFEGLIMHLAGIQIGNILALIFGNPVLAR
jgi:hypothetical protein